MITINGRMMNNKSSYVLVVTRPWLRLYLVWNACIHWAEAGPAVPLYWPPKNETPNNYNKKTGTHKDFESYAK